FQAEEGIRDFHVTGVQTCALPICERQNGEKKPGSNESLHVSHLLAPLWTEDEREDSFPGRTSPGGPTARRPRPARRSGRSGPAEIGRASGRGTGWRWGGASGGDI